MSRCCLRHLPALRREARAGVVAWAAHRAGGIADTDGERPEDAVMHEQIRLALAQRIARCRSAAVRVSVACGAPRFPCPAGVLSARSLLLGANTP
jgi:hypothetical protein